MVISGLPPILIYANQKHETWNLIELIIKYIIHNAFEARSCKAKFGPLGKCKKI